MKPENSNALHLWRERENTVAARTPFLRDQVGLLVAILHRPQILIQMWSLWERGLRGASSITSSRWRLRGLWLRSARAWRMTSWMGMAGCCCSAALSKSFETLRTYCD